MKVDNLPLLAHFEDPCSKILQLLAENLLNNTNYKRDFVTEKAFRQGLVGSLQTRLSQKIQHIRITKSKHGAKNEIR